MSCYDFFSFHGSKIKKNSSLFECHFYYVYLGKVLHIRSILLRRTGFTLTPKHIHLSTVKCNLHFKIVQFCILSGIVSCIFHQNR